jgi:hypothetical protein
MCWSPMHLKDKPMLRRQDDDPNKNLFRWRMECLLSVSTLATLTLIKLFVEFVETFNNFFNFFFSKNKFFGEGK